MAVIIYDTGGAEDEQYEIGELSQRILVYLMTDGPTQIEDIPQPVGAASVGEVRDLIESQLGPNAAGFVSSEQSSQQTIHGETITEYGLTDEGRQFVYNHKQRLSLPTNIEELSKKVSLLRVEVDQLLEQLEE